MLNYQNHPRNTLYLQRIQYINTKNNIYCIGFENRIIHNFFFFFFLLILLNDIIRYIFVTYKMVFDLNIYIYIYSIYMFRI